MQHAQQRVEALLEDGAHRLLPATAATPRPPVRLPYDAATAHDHAAAAAAAAASAASAASTALATAAAALPGAEARGEQWAHALREQQRELAL